jgi:hypothetical protein
MVLPRSISDVKRLRDKSDLPVDPEAECKAYAAYAKRFHWRTVVNEYTPTWLDYASSSLVGRITENGYFKESALGSVVGPWHVDYNHRVVFVGEHLNEESKFPGSRLPFTSAFTIKFARQLGDPALVAYWTNADVITDVALSRFKYIVAVGQVAAERACSMRIRTDQRIFAVPHPAYAYRWNNQAGLDAQQEIVDGLLPIKEVLDDVWKQTAYL